MAAVVTDLGVRLKTAGHIDQAFERYKQAADATELDPTMESLRKRRELPTMGSACKLMPPYDINNVRRQCREVVDAFNDDAEPCYYTPCEAGAEAVGAAHAHGGPITMGEAFLAAREEGARIRITETTRLPPELVSIVNAFSWAAHVSVIEREVEEDLARVNAAKAARKSSFDTFRNRPPCAERKMLEDMEDARDAESAALAARYALEIEPLKLALTKKKAEETEKHRAELKAFNAAIDEAEAILEVARGAHSVSFAQAVTDAQEAGVAHIESAWHKRRRLPAAVVDEPAPKRLCKAQPSASASGSRP